MSDEKEIMDAIIQQMTNEVNKLRMTNCALVYLLYTHHKENKLIVNLDELKDLIGKYLMFDRIDKDSFSVQLINRPPDPVIMNTKGTDIPV